MLTHEIPRSRFLRAQFLVFFLSFLFFSLHFSFSLPSTNGGTNNFPNPSQLLELFQLSAESFESRICIQLDPFRTCFNANTSPFTLSYVFNSYKVLFEGIQTGSILIFAFDVFFFIYQRNFFSFSYENCGSKFSLDKIRRSFFKIKEREKERDQQKYTSFLPRHFLFINFSQH